MSFKEKMKMVVSKVQAAACVYSRAVDAAEGTIMHACGSDRTVDEVVYDYASRGVVSIKKAVSRAPMVVLAKKKTTQDVLGELAQDEDLAAALRYVYMHPCIKVTVTEVHDAPVKGINCDGRAPMVCARVKNNGAPKAGVCDGGKAPAPKSMPSRMMSFVRKATGTPLVTVN